jgi:hypothetical protein
MILQVFPTPTGGAPIPSQLTGGNLTLAEVVNLITSTYGASKGAAFLTWYNAAIKQDPSLTPSEGATVWLTGSTLAQNLGTVASAEANIPGAAAQGASKAYQDILGGFNLGSWFLRIGEILLGLVLVGVGVAKLTGASNFISSAVKAKI